MSKVTVHKTFAGWVAETWRGTARYQVRGRDTEQQARDDVNALAKRFERKQG